RERFEFKSNNEKNETKETNGEVIHSSSTNAGHFVNSASIHSSLCTVRGRDGKRRHGKRFRYAKLWLWFRKSCWNWHWCGCGGSGRPLLCAPSQRLANRLCQGWR